MTAGPSETPIGEAVIRPFNSLTGPLTMLKPPCPSPALPSSQVPANWAVLQILAQSQILNLKRETVNRRRDDLERRHYSFRSLIAWRSGNRLYRFRVSVTKG